MPCDINQTSSNINDELSKIFDWLAVNKLSLNVQKTRYMLFHFPQKKLKATDIPQLHINEIAIQRVTEFNFLGLTIHENMKWDSHINKIRNKISKTVGVMNRIKRQVNNIILKQIYNALIAPHLNYARLCWGFSANKLAKTQKKAVRIITNSAYNAHTEPLFKTLGLLNVYDIFRLNSIKFLYKYCHKSLPIYFDTIFNTQEVTHVYNTRANMLPWQKITRAQRVQTENSIRYFAPKLHNSLPEMVTEKINTHSLNGTANYLRNYLLSLYELDCSIQNCYICQKG